MSKRAAEDEIGDATKKQFDEPTNGHDNHAVAEGEIAQDAAVEKSAESKPVLYHIQHYSSSRPLIAIHELGLADKIDVKVLTHPEIKTEEFLAMNPHGTIPVFKTAEGKVLLESGAITLHLVEKYGGLDHPLFGKPEQRPQLLQWLFYAPATLYPAILPAYGSDAEAKEKAQERLNSAQLAFISSELGTKQFILGDDFSLADVSLAYELAGLSHLKWLSKFPNVQDYINRLLERPAFKVVFG
jgi:glutathione S-transferase